MYYRRANAVLMCYSIDEYETFRSVEYRWSPQVKQHCPGIPVVLLGLKSDLRHDESINESGDVRRTSESQVSPEEGRLMARNIGKGGEQISVSRGGGGGGGVHMVGINIK